MKREVQKLFEKVARANHLNTRGRREYRRQFAREYQEIFDKVYGVISKFSDVPIDKETREAMLVALLAEFPPPPANAGADGFLSIALTPEAARLLRVITPPARDRA